MGEKSSKKTDEDKLHLPGGLPQAGLKKLSVKHHSKFAIAKEGSHIVETTASVLHRAHISLAGAIHLLEDIVPPIRLFLVGISSILDTLGAVYFSKKSTAHRTAQAAIAVFSTITVVLSLVIPHAALATLVAYAGLELIKEGTHLFEALKDYWKLRKVKHAVNQETLKHIRHIIIEKSIEIGFAALAVGGAVLALFSTAVFLGTPLPMIGLICVIASGALALTFRAGHYLFGKISAWYKRYKAQDASKQNLEVLTASEYQPVMPESHHYQQPGLPHESTTDIYQAMNTLKHEANMQPELVKAGWQPQPLMATPERQRRLNFWAAHRYRPYRIQPHYDQPSDSDGESESPFKPTTYHD